MQISIDEAFIMGEQTSSVKAAELKSTNFQKEIDTYISLMYFFRQEINFCSFVDRRITILINTYKFQNYPSTATAMRLSFYLTQRKK